MCMCSLCVICFPKIWIPGPGLTSCVYQTVCVDSVRALQQAHWRSEPALHASENTENKPPLYPLPEQKRASKVFSPTTNQLVGVPYYETSTLIFACLYITLSVYSHLYFICIFKQINLPVYQLVYVH